MSAPGQPAPHQPPHTQPGATPALTAPWRLAYLEALDAAERAPADNARTPTGSFLLDYWLSPDRDRENHVLLRTASGLILLNKYPYANGHLLVALGEARPTLLDYTPAQRAQLWMLTELATDLMQRTLLPQGINIGINQGRAAGAGVPQHLHVHLVPRWGGDVNFMHTVGSVRVMPGSLDAMWDRYAAQTTRTA
ncbi:MAG: HIT domain-containing protein [Phycisphaerales bacterium]